MTPVACINHHGRIDVRLDEFHEVILRELQGVFPSVRLVLSVLVIRALTSSMDDALDIRDCGYHFNKVMYRSEYWLRSILQKLW